MGWQALKHQEAGRSMKYYEHGGEWLLYWYTVPVTDNLTHGARQRGIGQLFKFQTNVGGLMRCFQADAGRTMLMIKQGIYLPGRLCPYPS